MGNKCYVETKYCYKYATHSSCYLMVLQKERQFKINNFKK